MKKNKNYNDIINDLFLDIDLPSDDDLKNETRIAKISLSKTGVKPIRNDKISEKQLLSKIKNCFFVRELSDKLGITEVTTRKLLKEYGLKDYFKNITIPNKIKKEKFTSYGGANTNKPILCFYYPEMKPFRKKKFNSIKEADAYFNVTSVGKVINGITNYIRWNDKKITFKKQIK